MQWEDGKIQERRSNYSPSSPPESDVLKPLSASARSLEKGSVYEHYKGKRYRLISVGRNSETLEEVVIYQSLYGDHDVWSRPLSMFVEHVEFDGKSIPRFKKISEIQ